MTDQEILALLQTSDLQGGRKALTAIYKDNYYMIENYILKNSGTKEDAKDIFQDSMVVLYKNMKKDSFRLFGKISTYIYSVARNLWLKKLRDNKILISSLEENDDSYISDSNIIIDLEYSESQRMIGKLLNHAGVKCKDLLRSFYYEKLSMKKIASTQGYSSEQIAKNQKVRCLKKIRSILNKTENYFNNLESSY